VTTGTIGALRPPGDDGDAKEPLPPASGVRAAGPVRSWRADLVEFMLVGGATLVLLPLAWVVRKAFGLDPSEYAISYAAFYAAYVINDPHFAVTYLLFYKGARQRAFGDGIPAAQRVRWLVAGVLVPVVLGAWGAVALAVHSAPVLGWMIQLMFLLVGWHYVKQGFGVLTVLSARRGVQLLPRERTALLAHAYLGWAYAWSNPATPGGEFEERGVVYHAIAHPAWLEIGCGALLAASAVALVIVLGAGWVRERRLLPLAPLLGFLVTVWSWTIYSNFDPLLRYVIPALHSVQYLYFVWLMKRNEAREAEGPPTFGRPVVVRLGVLALSALGLGWLLFHGAPTFLDTAFVSKAKVRAAMDPLGETPFFATLFVFVNIHHYFMDHAVWRRENPDTRYLRVL
jgi:hypothetical protein